MKNISTKIVLFGILIGIILGCNTTKKVPNGEYLLTKNKFEFLDHNKAFGSLVPEYVKQKPNGVSMIGTLPFKLLLYNAVPSRFDSTFLEYYDLSKKTRNRHSLDSLLVKNGLSEYKGRSLWLKRFIFRQGEPPVIIDSSLSSFSAENLERFYFDRGYFDAQVDASYILDSASKKGQVHYHITPGEKSIIASYNYNIKDSTIGKHYESLLSRGSRIKVGERYDMDHFVGERDKIVDFLKNRGYWKFNDDGQAIEFTADTTNSDKQLDVTLLIPVEKDDSTLVKQKFARYRYGEIHLYPDSNYNPDADELPVYFDTIYDGYHLHYVDPKMKYRPKFFTDALVVKDSSLYRLNAENQSKRNLSKREGVSMTGFYTHWDQSSLIKNDSVINLHVSFKPKKKYDLFYGADLSWSEFMNFGVSPQVSILVRNLFRGGENLETTLRGTLGNVNKKFSADRSFFNAFEMAFQSKINFPYLLLPFKTDNLFQKKFYKQTDLRVGTSVQRNIGLGRVNYTTGLDYSVSFRDSHSHQISLLNTEFINNMQKDNYFSVFTGDDFIKDDFLNRYYFMYNPSAAIQYDQGLLTDEEVIDLVYEDQAFIETLDADGLEYLSIFQNMNFRRQTITQDVLIMSLIYQFTLNQSEKANKKNPWFFKGKVEFAGNMLGLMDKAFGFKHTETSPGQESGMVLKVPYSQFFKIDLDVRKYFTIGPKSTIATRAFLGLIQPYGNTDFIPFSRSYTAGGANDIRAWSAATLGPAALPRYAGGDDVFAIERLKLLLSAEYRFNVYDRLNSAVFVDAGNIWGTDKDDELIRFKFNEFYKELGVGAGWGLRMDLTYFLLRFDFAYKLYDPSYTEGNRWRLNDFNILKPRLAFGINYPF